MFTLTSGRTEPCKDNIGGIKNIYLMPFVEYDHTEIVLNGSQVTSFPNSFVYKYDIRKGSYVETINNDEEGISYDQVLNFTMFKIDLLTTNEIDNATKLDLRYIVELNDGTFRIAGLYTGAKIDNMNIDSGGSKSDFNGYNVTINSSEEISAPFLDSLSGFSVVDQDYQFLFEDEEEYTFEDSVDFTIN